MPDEALSVEPPPFLGAIIEVIYVLELECFFGAFPSLEPCTGFLFRAFTFKLPY